MDESTLKHLLNLYTINGTDNENEIIDMINIDVVNTDSIRNPPRIMPIVLFRLTIKQIKPICKFRCFRCR